MQPSHDVRPRTPPGPTARWGAATVLGALALAMAYVTVGAVVALGDGVTFAGMLRLAIEAIATLVLGAAALRVARGRRSAAPSDHHGMVTR